MTSALSKQRSKPTELNDLKSNYSALLQSECKDNKILIFSHPSGHFFISVTGKAVERLILFEHTLNRFLKKPEKVTNNLLVIIYGRALKKPFEALNLGGSNKYNVDQTNI